MSGPAAAALDVEFEDMGAVDQAVYGGDGHGVAGEDLAPGAERLVGDHQERAVLVAGPDQLEQDAGLRLLAGCGFRKLWPVISGNSGRLGSVGGAVDAGVMVISPGVRAASGASSASGRMGGSGRILVRLARRADADKASRDEGSQSS